MIRSVCAVAAAVVAWFVWATIGNGVLRLLIPGYTAVEAAMTFTLTMQLGRLAVGLLASLGAGAVCAAVATGRWPVRAAAAVLVLLFVPVHYSLWQKFPLWYHAFFLLTLAPAMLLGAALWRARAQRRPG